MYGSRQVSRGTHFYLNMVMFYDYFMNIKFYCFLLTSQLNCSGWFRGPRRDDFTSTLYIDAQETIYIEKGRLLTSDRKSGLSLCFKVQTNVFKPRVANLKDLTHFSKQ